ncbi:alanine racemase [Sphingomonas nostoxanthinifaciens]|uniref:alanine racemase n=1 Tax=Sphingomonas nostoxanthinifaciens TaxID=2872652 RepID=UPI001CC1E78D|nr:alanine racemase [Sphingomonas nostoxanthinifaciens]UAK25408.1 alanine racemase [Sphingomonas nostoxanthinifaciens]
MTRAAGRANGAIVSSPLRLDLDGDALAANWRTLAARGGSAACGAAVKADGYGLGAAGVVARLWEAGCRDFFVSNWAEAAALLALAPGSVAVLHGVRDEDMAQALAGAVRPVLSTPAQVKRWRDGGGGACDVMVDTGMNRLGLSAAQAASGLLDGLAITTLMSHLACADEPDHPLNPQQRDAFRAVAAAVPAQRYSLANSAGIMLGPDYAFDLTRPGLGLYGGVPTSDAAGLIRRVVTPAAEVLQVRDVSAGASVGYGATWDAPRPSRVAIVNLGYADGIVRGLGPSLRFAGGLPAIGRVSMDLIAIDVTDGDVGAGDWLALDFGLPALAAASGLSQYELLTGLGDRFERRWV